MTKTRLKRLHSKIEAAGSQETLVLGSSQSSQPLDLSYSDVQELNEEIKKRPVKKVRVSNITCSPAAVESFTVACKDHPTISTAEIPVYNMAGSSPSQKPLVRLLETLPEMIDSHNQEWGFDAFEAFKKGNAQGKGMVIETETVEAGKIVKKVRYKELPKEIVEKNIASFFAPKKTFTF